MAARTATIVATVSPGPSHRRGGRHDFFALRRFADVHINPGTPLLKIVSAPMHDEIDQPVSIEIDRMNKMLEAGHP